MSVISNKKSLVQDIQNNFNDCKAVIFYNFHQTSNRDIFLLKRELKKTGSKWKVYKNSLAKKALADYSLNLKKANAFIFCHEDEYKPLTILAKFNKEHSDIKRFQGGIYEKKFVDDIILEKWSNLPNKEVLMNTLCYYLNWQIRRFINLLENLKKNKVK